MKKSFLVTSLFFLPLFLFTSTSLLGQNAKENDTLSHYTFQELSDKFYAAKPDSLKAVIYAKRYLKKAIFNMDTIRQANGNYYLSDVTKDSTYFINYWNRIIKSTKNSKSSLYPAKAYLDIGYFYFHKGRKKTALNNYLNAYQSVINKKNDSLKFTIKLHIGIIRSSNGEYNEAIKLYEDTYLYFNKPNTYLYLNNDFQNLLINLSSCYLKIENIKKALYYNNLAEKYTLKFTQKDVIGYIYFNKGKIHHKNMDYDKAIISFKKALPYIINDENLTTLSRTYLSLANSYLKKPKSKHMALKYYNLIDSLYNVSNYYFNTQKPTYKYLINHYKKEKNDVKQLEYINKYIEVDSVLNARAKSISKNLTENYDIPNLLEEKKLIEDRLKSKLSTFEKWIWGISLFALVVFVFLIIQYKKRKLYKERFKQLLEKPIEKVPNKTTTKKDSNIPKETLDSINLQLEQFESENQFISTDTSLSILAKKFQTNSKYLSQVINQEKGQSFNNYINQLRINYTVEKLKADKRFRKYSVKAIAQEVGFNTTESFSKAFFKFTGIKPSYFIKELENQ